MYVDESSVIGTSDVWACIRLCVVHHRRPAVGRVARCAAARATIAPRAPADGEHHAASLGGARGVHAHAVPALLSVDGGRRGCRGRARLAHAGATARDRAGGPARSWGLVPPARYRIGGTSVSAEELIILELVPMPTPDQWLGIRHHASSSDVRLVLASSNYARSWWAEAGAPGVAISTDQASSTMRRPTPSATGGWRAAPAVAACRPSWARARRRDRSAPTPRPNRR